MENKNGNLSKVFLLIAIILIVVMGALLYMQNTEADRQIAELENNKKELQENINNLQEKINDLQVKLDRTSNVVDDNIQNNNLIKIEGEYHLVESDNLEGVSYKFEGNTVQFLALYSLEGTYEIEDNKIKITYLNAYDADGSSMDFLGEEYVELTIVDENTLTSQKVIDGVVYNGKYVKKSISKDNIQYVTNNVDELPNNEEITELITKFINLDYEQLPLGILREVGYDNLGEIYENALQSCNEGDSIPGEINGNEYGNTKIKYSDFEEKMCNYMTPDVVRTNFSGFFVEHNGFLYSQTIDAAGGVSVSDITAEFICEKNNAYLYLVKYVYIYYDESIEYECIISIGEYNNKNVVSGVFYKSNIW